MDMLEKAARATHTELSRANVIAYLDMPDDTADRIARAVLLAIREPSESVVDAGYDSLVDAGCNPIAIDVLECWQAMINTILGGD